MKILKFLPFLLLIVLLGLGIYFAIGFDKQIGNQDYADFVKASSEKVLEETNNQSKGINGIENLVETEEETLNNLEKTSAEFKTILAAEKDSFNSQSKPQGSDEVNNKLTALYEKAEAVNEQFDELVSDVKNLSEGEEVLEALKNYNTSVSELAAIYDEFADELDKFIADNDTVKL